MKGTLRSDSAYLSRIPGFSGGRAGAAATPGPGPRGLEGGRGEPSSPARRAQGLHTLPAIVRV